MRLDDLIKSPGEWLQGSGPQSPIVISSRCRLARNLSDFPFSHWADESQRAAVAEGITLAAHGVGQLADALEVDLDAIEELDRLLLVERHLISPEQADGPGGRRVIIGEREMLSLMVNEEDHLRIQCLTSGFAVTDVWRLANTLDDELGATLDFAYSSEWGYLTACPTNVGTGMRASAMLHLPALVMSRQINKVIQAIGKLGLVARGLFGEGTQPSGNFFQISNQITLGQSEDAVIGGLESVVRQIVGHEKTAREMLLRQKQAQTEDRVFRAAGLLRHARIISSQETIDLLSDLRLGVDLGLIEDVSPAAVNELFILTQPAHLQKLCGKPLEPAERDIRRADIIRQRLADGR